MMTEFFVPFPELKSDRLILRRCIESDTDAFYALASNTKLTETLTWSAHESKEITAEFIKSMQKGYDEGNCHTWAIANKATNIFMGLIGLRISKKNNRGEIGYWMGVPHWNSGYMTEAVKTLIAFCFKVLQLNRIQAEHFTTNPASGKVMEKANMKFEGLLRQYILCQDVYMDCKMYSILRDNYAQKNGSNYLMGSKKWK